MTGGDTDEPTADEPSPPDPGDADTAQPSSRISYLPDGDADGLEDVFDPDEPRLPTDAAVDDGATAPVAPAAPVNMPVHPPRAAVASAYRSPQERNRSVYRRANPWYRRLGRGVTALALLGVVGVGVYVAARGTQDYLNRDQLPEAAPDVPTIRESSFLVIATTPTIQLEGTLIADFETRSFEFVGLAGTANANDRITRPDSDVVYARNQNATWRVVGADDPALDLVATIDATIDVLAGSDTADVILTSQIRRDYVNLIEESEEGEGDNTRTRYDVALDLDAFAERFPVQWQSFQQNAIPGVDDSPRLEVSMWTDDESVLVRVQDESTGWNWERLDYSSGEFEAFQPPVTQIVNPETAETAIAIDCQVDGLQFATILATCDEATAVGRQLAASVGLTDSADAPDAGPAFAALCAVLQGGEPATFEEDAYVELAGLLVDTGVCSGDTALVQPVD